MSKSNKRWFVFVETDKDGKVIRETEKLWFRSMGAAFGSIEYKLMNAELAEGHKIRVRQDLSGIFEGVIA